MKIDFSRCEAGKFSNENLRTISNNTEAVIIDRSAEIIKEEGDSFLRATYPKNEFGARSCGFQFIVPLSPASSYSLSYSLRFSGNFDFVSGGKLPGLTSGGAKWTGGNQPKNGEGWSARYMWRKNGEAVIYFYSVEHIADWGTDYPLGVNFIPGKWHTITQELILNSPDKKDGEMKVIFDGTEVFCRNDVEYRKGRKGLIDSFFFSTFHGGNTPDLAPSRTCYADFKDIEIYQLN